MPDAMKKTHDVQVLKHLSERLQALRPSPREATARWTTGWKDFDDWLPGGGFRPGGTIEWLSSGNGAGSLTLALATASRATRGRGGLVIFDHAGDLYPPGVFHLGLSDRPILFVRPSNAAEELWAWEQVLRSPKVGLAIGTIDRISDKSLRRLNLAAEQGETLGVWIRPDWARGSPCWSDARLWVEPKGEGSLLRHWSVTLDRAKNARERDPIEVTWDEETGSLSVVSSLVHSAARFSGSVARRRSVSSSGA